MENIFLISVLTLMNVFLLKLFLSLSALPHVCDSIEIRRFSVPRWLENGTENFVILDCEYTYNENDLRLVVKWFFKDNLEPVYQWIPELNLRHISGVLKNRLDLNFSVNTADTYSQFRALKIVKPTIELSGKYTCMVTSLAGQDTKEQVMTVFVPAKEFDLSYTSLDGSTINVTCEAQHIYPPPLLKLYLSTSEDSPMQSVAEETRYIKLNLTSIYDAYLFRTFSANELFSNGVSAFECSLELPGTNYARKKKLNYYQGARSHKTDAAHSLYSASCKLNLLTLQHLFFLISFNIFVYSSL